MDTRAIIKTLTNHDNCYVQDMPSDYKLKKVENVLGVKLTVRSCMHLDSGYVIEKVKGGDNNENRGVLIKESK